MAAARIRALAPAIEDAHARLGRAPALAVLAADDAASGRFIAIKRAAFEAARLMLRAQQFPADTGTSVVRAAIDAMNEAAGVDGIFLQFPLPPRVDGELCAESILAAKDIDAAGPLGLGRLLTGAPRFVPAAPLAVLELLADGLGDLLRRTILVIGADDVTSRTLLLLCIARGAVCARTDPLDAALGDELAGVDAAVVTGALPSREALRHLRSGAVLVDAAYYQPPRPPDWLPERTRTQLGAWHPQYGSVGPLTVALLMEATVRAAVASAR